MKYKPKFKIGSYVYMMSPVYGDDSCPECGHNRGGITDYKPIKKFVEGVKLDTNLTASKGEPVFMYKISGMVTFIYEYDNCGTIYKTKKECQNRCKEEAEEWIVK